MNRYITCLMIGDYKSDQHFPWKGKNIFRETTR